AVDGGRQHREGGPDLVRRGEPGQRAGHLQRLRPEFAAVPRRGRRLPPPAPCGRPRRRNRAMSGPPARRRGWLATSGGLAGAAAAGAVAITAARGGAPPAPPSPLTAAPAAPPAATARPLPTNLA